MAQVTTNTEISTINILQEATSVEDTDLFLLQRGSTTLKLKSNNLNISLDQLGEIGDKKVLGNVSGALTPPYPINILTSSESDIGPFSDTELVTEKRIKEWVNTQIQQSEENSTSDVIFLGLDNQSFGTSFSVFNAPPSAVRTSAIAALPNLSAGTSVMVSWRSTGHTGGGNGTAYNFRSFVSAYDVITSSNWAYTTTITF
jgi:hypothetical protein